MKQKRKYNTRLSRKVVLEYLESAYPKWLTFEEICNGLPILNVDCINLTVMLYDLLDKGKIERIKSGAGLDELEEWRLKQNAR